MTITLFPHQKRELDETKHLNKVAYYHDMGLGKTFTGSEKLVDLNENLNLLICQKSKVDDWKNHFTMYYPYMMVLDLTSKKEYELFKTIALCNTKPINKVIGIINYELVFRRNDLLKAKDFTLMLDESSMIQNERAKRTKFIMKLKYKNLILLSGTPTSGRYERLYSQMKMLGWDISKTLYYKQFIITDTILTQGFPIKIIRGYKNVDRLKEKMREHGCRFLKTDEVFDLPKQIFTTVNIKTSRDYQTFKRDRIVTIDGDKYVGDSALSRLLYERLLCGAFNKNKVDALKDILESSDDRIIIFYNFHFELNIIEDLCLKLNRPVSIINGQEKDLSCYEEYDNSVTLIQYQAGSMGLNLQKANKLIYFTPPLSSEYFEQSKKRIHRIGQDSTCFYYMLTCSHSVEEHIYKALAMRKDYTDRLFINDDMKEGRM